MDDALRVIDAIAGHAESIAVVATLVLTVWQEWRHRRSVAPAVRVFSNGHNSRKE